MEKIQKVRYLSYVRRGIGFMYSRKLGFSADKLDLLCINWGYHMKNTVSWV